MSNKATGKMKLYKILSNYVFPLIFVIAFLLPIIKIEWSTRKYGIQEQYYVNASVVQCVLDEEVQIYTNAMVRIEKSDYFDGFEDEAEAFCLTKENINKTSWKLDIGELRGQESELKSIITTLTIILICTLFFCFMNIASNKNKQKLEHTMRSLKTQPLERLTRKQRNLYFLNEIGVDSTVWTTSIFYLILLAVAIVLCMASFDESKGYTTVSINIPIVVGILIVNIVFAVALQILANDIIKEESIRLSAVEKVQSTDSEDTLSVAKNEIQKTANNFSQNVEKLIEYKKLLDSEIITKDEFDKKKEELLSEKEKI